MGTSVLSRRSRILFNMKACILLLVLAAAVQAQTYICKGDEMWCPGLWNEDWTKQEPDFCIPLKNGDCWTNCPPQCLVNQIVCPGKFDYKTGEQLSADYCIPKQTGDCLNTCPMDCGKDMMVCPGGMDPKGCPMPDMCFPKKRGKKKGKKCPKM